MFVRGVVGVSVSSKGVAITNFVSEPPRSNPSFTLACDAVMFSCWSMAHDADIFVSGGDDGDAGDSSPTSTLRCDSDGVEALRFNESPSLLMNSSTRRRTRVSRSFC